MVNTEPTFEEGPFFLANDMPLRKSYIVWSTDETTAAGIFRRETAVPPLHTIVLLIGDLDAVKLRFRLSPAQIADLHREGYLRL